MILIDCDGVITNTIRMFVELNNKENGQNDGYKLVDDWDFRPICNNFSCREEVDEFFRHKKLYEFPIFYKDAIKNIKYLDSKYNLAICTSGDNINLANKYKMFDKYFKDINVITIAKNKKNALKIGKDMIDCDIIVDDHIGNLEGSKAKLKILFEPEEKRYKWNEGWGGLVVKDWEELVTLIEEFYILEGSDKI